MDADTQQILERSRQRRAEIERELAMEKADKSHAVKRKQCEDVVENRDPLKDEESVAEAKKPSFGESDRERPVRPPRKSLQSGAESTTPLKEIEPKQDQNPASGRKAKFAALAAQLDDFDCEIEKSGGTREKSSFERGPTPKSLEQLKREKALREQQENTTKESSSSSNSNKVHFGSPVAQIALSCDELDDTGDDLDDNEEEEKEMESEKPSEDGENVGLDAFYKVTESTVRKSSSGRGDFLDSLERNAKAAVNDEEIVQRSSERRQALKKEMNDTPEKKASPQAEKKNSTLDFEQQALKSSPRISTPTKKSTGKPTDRVISNVFKKIETKAATPHVPIWRERVKNKDNNDIRPRSEVITDSQSVDNLRNRWEVSSSTGTPLHPDTTGDALMKAAGQMFKKKRDQAVRFSAIPVQKEYGSVAEQAVKLSSPNPNCDDEGTDVQTTEESSADESEERQVEVVAVEKEPAEPQPSAALSRSRTDEFIDEVFTLAMQDEQGRDVAADLSRESAEFLELEARAEEKKEQPAANLLHSVSFYRNVQKQQRQQNTVPSSSPLALVSTTTGSPSSPQLEGLAAKRDKYDERRFLERKIKMVAEAITVQQEQISQASRALGYCQNRPEFRGSREEVDAQRALLLATEKRKALYGEYDRVKTLLERGSSALTGSQGAPTGTLTISHITVKLARDFINENCNRHSRQRGTGDSFGAGDMLWYFVCLIKREESVHATTMITSDEGLAVGNLEFANYIQLKGLKHDFNVKLEIYSLRTRREVLTHEEKYKLSHMLSGGGTLKKKQQKASSSSYYGVTSPGGPMAIVDPGFQKIGNLNLTLKMVNRGKFMLEFVDYPLDGAVFVKLRCYADSAGAVEHRGFLSMYQEVSGYGSWTRFWCLLRDGQLKFWRYPDEENDKEETAVVDLSGCRGQEAQMVNREECSRPNTFALQFHKADQSKAVLRVLVSADNRAECQAWFDHINTTLRNLRLWNPNNQ